jgi:hypothetical protein
MWWTKASKRKRQAALEVQSRLDFQYLLKLNERSPPGLAERLVEASFNPVPMHFAGTRFPDPGPLALAAEALWFGFNNLTHAETRTLATLALIRIFKDCKESLSVSVNDIDLGFIDLIREQLSRDESLPDIVSYQSERMANNALKDATEFLAKRRV